MHLENGGRGDARNGGYATESRSWGTPAHTNAHVCVRVCAVVHHNTSGA